MLSRLRLVKRFLSGEYFQSEGAAHVSTHFLPSVRARVHARMRVLFTACARDANASLQRLWAVYDLMWFSHLIKITLRRPFEDNTCLRLPLSAAHAHMRTHTSTHAGTSSHCLLHRDTCTRTCAKNAVRSQRRSFQTAWNSLVFCPNVRLEIMCVCVFVCVCLTHLLV